MKALQLQLIQGTPIGLALSVRFLRRRYRRRGRAFPSTFAIAMGMRGKVQQNIFAHVRSEIDHFGPGQFMVNRKRRNLDIEPKRLQTANAFQFDRLRQMTRDPERTFGDAEIERVAQRTGALDVFCFEIGNRTLFFALEMLAFALDLAQMNFHLSLVRNAFATRAGTNSVTSPPSRAISFTIRELRYVYSSFGIRKIVSTAASSFRFIRAIWNSNSKSEMARSPRMTAVAFFAIAKSTSNPRRGAISTFLILPSAPWSRSSRSSSEKRGCFC